MLKLILVTLVTLSSLAIAAQPVINNFSPAGGPAGTVVTITGANFSASPAANIVYFGTGRATVTAAATGSLTVVVPACASYQPITVTTGYLTAWSAKPFLLTFPGGSVTTASYDYAASVDSIYGLESNDLTVSDFNGDNRPDVAMVDRLHNIVSIYTNTGTGGQVSFSAKTDLATGNTPWHLISGDLNGDGKADIVVANQADNTVSIFQNTGTGGTLSFAPAIVLATGQQPGNMAIRDMDGDGRPDLLVCNFYFPGSFSAFRNTGTGGTLSFAAGTIIPTLGATGPVSLEDMDGDGKPDIVAAGTTSNMLFILQNTSTTGAISFGATAQFATGNFPDGLAVGDLDGDGRPDIATPNFYSGTVSVFTNTSTSGNIVLSRTDYPAGQSPVAALLSDADGDGHADLLVLNSYESIAIYRNTGSPGSLTLASKADVPTPLLSTGMAAVDFDGDGKTDVVGLTGIFRALVYRNKADWPYITGFSPASAPAGGTLTITGANFTGTTAVSIGGIPASSFTVNSSTTITAVLGTGASGVVTVTTGKGTAGKNGFKFLGPPALQSFSPVSGSNGTVDTIRGTSFTGTTAVSFGGVAALSFTVVDDSTITAVVGDGASGSVAVTNTYGTGSLPGFIHMAPVITSFTPASAGPGATIAITGDHFTGATSVTLGGTPAATFTVNSPTSITAVVGGGSAGDVVVTTSYGTGKLSGFAFNSPPPPVISSFSPQSGPAGSSITITGANFNSSLTGNIVYFGATPGIVTAASAGQLTVTVPAGASYKPFSVLNATTHLTGYSRQPFAMTFPGGGAVTPVMFSARKDIYYDPNKSPGDALVSDFDGDGKPDIAFMNTYWNISVLRNTSKKDTITFVPPVTLGADVSNNTASTIFAGDVDGDGKPDLVYGETHGRVYVVRNTSTPGNIAFDTAVIFGVAADPHGIAIADLDGDGRPELVVANYGSSNVSVLRNTSVPGIISFAPKIDYASAGYAITVAVGDLDGDGKPEIVIANPNSSPGISILRNTSQAGAIAFAPRADIPTSGGCNLVDIADINKDGKPEIIARYAYSFAVLKNTSVPGSLSLAQDLVRTFPSTLLQDFTIGDVDGDGAPDIIVSFWSNGALAGFKNISTADSIALGPEVDFNGGATAWAIAAVDLDGDGRPDLTTAIPDYHAVDVLHNQAGAPYITSFTPTSSAEWGTVTITGIHFTGATSVQFGSVPAHSFTVVNDTTITAVVGADGYGAVTVTTPAGTYSYGYFNFIPPFKLYGFDPVNAGKGTVVTITGASMTNITGVSFGGVPASSYTVYGNTIEAVVGDGASGYVKVTKDTATDSLPGFHFIQPPTITGFTPALAGFGHTVGITGTHLDGTTALSFGGVPAFSFYVINPDSILAYVAFGASGAISLTTPGGTASMDGFTFVKFPGIFSFTPTAGGQGSVITISGVNLTNVTKVAFGDVPARSFTIHSDSMITAVVDTGASGQVYVENPAGSEGVAGFTFAFPPALQSFSPTGGTRGDTILITGTDLTTAITVSIGGVPAASFTVLSPTSIKAVLGEGASGDVSVVTAGGTAALPGFTYYPSPRIDSFTPDKAAKGETVTIRGVDFTGAQSVSFGGIPAAAFTILSDSVLTAVVSTGASGDITVTNSYGKGSKSGFTFVLITAVGSLPGSGGGQLILHPNPVHTILVVQYPPSFRNATLTCYDLTGRRVRQVQLAPNTGELEMPVGDLAAGIYKINWSDGKTQLTGTMMVW